MPVITSTVDVSEKGLPVSRVSMRARSSLRSRRSLTALRRMRERSGRVVADQEAKAFLAEEMAALMEDSEELWIMQTGWAVEGSIDWKVCDEEEGCGAPE